MNKFDVFSELWLCFRLVLLLVASSTIWCYFSGGWPRLFAGRGNVQIDLLIGQHNRVYFLEKVVVHLFHFLAATIRPLIATHFQVFLYLFIRYIIIIIYLFLMIFFSIIIFLLLLFVYLTAI